MIQKRDKMKRYKMVSVTSNPIKKNKINQLSLKLNSLLGYKLYKNTLRFRHTVNYLPVLIFNLERSVERKMLYVKK